MQKLIIEVILVKTVPFILLVLFWAGVLFFFINHNAHRDRLSLRIDAYSGCRAEEKQIKRFCDTVRQKIFSFIEKRKPKKNYIDELSAVLAYLKNIAILGRASNISAQSLLEELSDISNELRPVFLSMAQYLNTNDKASASECLGEKIGTSYARDIGRFLAGWEDLPPQDMLHSIEMYQSALREEKITLQKRRDETISDIVYFPVIINCMLILLNFIYVAYFIEQKEMLEIMFL